MSLRRVRKPGQLCVHGHLLTKDNMIWRKDGRFSMCGVCHAKREKLRYEANKKSPPTRSLIKGSDRRASLGRNRPHGPVYSRAWLKL